MVLRNIRRIRSSRPFGLWAGIGILGLFGLVHCGSRSSANGVGVAQCDEYVARVQACASRDPRMKAMAPAFAAQEDAWKQMARRDLATVQANCEAALAALNSGPSTCAAGDPK